MPAALPRSSPMNKMVDAHIATVDSKHTGYIMKKLAICLLASAAIAGPLGCSHNDDGMSRGGGPGYSQSGTSGGDTFQQGSAGSSSGWSGTPSSSTPGGSGMSGGSINNSGSNTQLPGQSGTMNYDQNVYPRGSGPSGMQSGQHDGIYHSGSGSSGSSGQSGSGSTGTMRNTRADKKRHGAGLRT